MALANYVTGQIVESDGVTYTALQASINEPPFLGSAFWRVGCYTENAALCIADYLTDQTYGFKTNLGTDIPLGPLIAAANVSDEAVPLAVGYHQSPPALVTEPRYACNGRFPLTLTRGAVLENLLTSCAGRILYSAGQFIIQPEAYWPGVSWLIGSTGETPGNPFVQGTSGFQNTGSTLSVTFSVNVVAGDAIVVDVLGSIGINAAGSHARIHS